MRIVAAAVLAPCMVLASVWPASAWNDTGHQVIALIAWDNLSPGPRSKLVAMMRRADSATRLPGLFPQDRRPMDVRAREFFRRAATWPDLVRDVRDLHHSTWHHRAFYWRQDNGRAVDLPDLHVHPENLLERLGYFEKVLSSPSVPARERAIGIAWVLHLVGDIHQPLHCSARVTAIERNGDHGGQDFELMPTLPAQRPGDRRSLHTYWDDMLDRAVPRRSGEGLGVYLQRAAALVVSLHPRTQLEAALRPGQFEAWARESLIAAQSAYPVDLRRGQEPSADYRDKGIDVALGRLALGGYRLALMLRDIAGVVEP